MPIPLPSSVLALAASMARRWPVLELSRDWLTVPLTPIPPPALMPMMPELHAMWTVSLNRVLSRTLLHHQFGISWIQPLIFHEACATGDLVPIVLVLYLQLTIYLTNLNSFVQRYVRLVIWDSVVALPPGLDVSRFATTKYGEQCAAPTGTSLMWVWPADSSALHHLVSVWYHVTHQPIL